MKITQLIGLILAGFVVASVHAAPPFHAQGELSGEVTASSVLLQSRLTATPGPTLDPEGDIPGAKGVACFEWSPTPDFAKAQRTAWLEASAEHDFIVRAHLKGLQPGTRYYYRLVFGPDKSTVQTGPTCEFKTLSAPDDLAPLAFCMGSCMNYHSFLHGKANGGGPVTASAEDKQLGYPVFAAMTKLKPDFFIGTGDIVYYDHPPQTAAHTLVELRRKWHEQFRFPRLIEFFSHTPAYWSKDDHDFRFNDADLGGKKLPEPATGIEIFREQMPIFAAGDRTTPTYRTHRVHKHLQLWFTEGRDYRSPNKQPDGPEKSIWGREQRNWLEQTLQASDATWKVIITPTPMVGPDRNSKVDNHTNLAGFKHEADSFFAWLREQKQDRVLTFCGDRHWQYHSIHPLGVEEFSVGALNDENAIRGEKPGGKGTTDPDGLIRQPYIYREPTGGFLHVTVHGDGRLVLTHHDDHGVVLNSVTKSITTR
ncbi:MAG: alkaline phosphatase D family protein [Planctomycetaceae bacterium]|nr:alkaline phosphatase D family protein [Planctomycetaceae bacterium]